MKNILRGAVQRMQTLEVVCAHPATPASGDPVRINTMNCSTAVANEGADGVTVVMAGEHIATFSVKGVDANGDSAVALWDNLYYVDADTPKLSKKATGYFFGKALGTVTGGATGTIKVLVLPFGRKD